MLAKPKNRMGPCAESALMLLLETVLGSLLVWWFVDEAPGGYAILGGFAIITVLVLYSMPAREKKENSPQRTI